MASSDASDARSSRSAISATPKSASPVAAQFFSWDAGVTLAAMLLHAAWIASVARESYGRTSPFASISVLLPFTASMGYALLVFLGPRIMRNRKPLSMSGSMFVYNVYQCLFNAVVVVAAVATILLNGFRWWGIPLDLTTPAQTGLGIVIYLHYRCARYSPLHWPSRCAFLQVVEYDDMSMRQRACMRTLSIPFVSLQ